MDTCAYEGGTCREPRWPESPAGLCVYHAPENSLSPDRAAAVWREARSRCEARATDFTGWHFPAHERGFRGVTFITPAKFSKATFDGEARFQNAVFRERTVFDDAAFLGKARFEYVRFDSEVRLGGARFTDEALFASARFQHEVTFRHAEFQKTASFYGTLFEGRADFGGTVFQETAGFDSAAFRQDAVFRGVTFKNVLNVFHAVFEKSVDLEGASLAVAPAFHNAVLVLGPKAVLGLQGETPRHAP